MTTSTPLCGARTRPVVHFTPQRNWMNDPNGLVFHDGLFHLYFQHNPLGLDHGNISWGHAVSRDLVHWRERALAISFDDHEQVFSGSVVVDDANTSGLGQQGNGPMVALYTSARVDGVQAQSLAYSHDGGDTWEKFEGNPVLDRRSADFRDPKVIRFHGESEDYWVMIAVEAAERRVLFYRSDDLTSWTLLSSYGPAGAVGGVWECPDLFPLPVEDDPSRIVWVLLISLNPGGVAGGSGTQYVTGDFDGTRFTPFVEHRCMAGDDESLPELDWLDFGRDCYAGVTFNGLPVGERIFMAWMSNWDYAHDLPASPHRGAMTVARRLSLTHLAGRLQLRARPVLPPGARSTDIVLTQDVITVDVPPVAVIELEPPRAAGLITLTVCDGRSSIQVAVDPGQREIRCDRRGAGLGLRSDRFASVEIMPWPINENDGDTVTLLTDHDSIEIFAADGLRTLTDLVFLGPDRTLTVARRNVVEHAVLRIADLTRRRS